MSKASEFVKNQAIDTVKQTIVSYLTSILLVATLVGAGYFALDYYFDKKVEDTKQVIVDKTTAGKDALVKALTVSSVNTEEAIQVTKEKAQEAKEQAVESFNAFFSKHKTIEE